MATHNRPSIIFIMSYHNNLYDTIKALQMIANVKVLSPKPTDRVIYEKKSINIAPIKTYFRRFYAPPDLLRNIPHQTTHIVVKNIHQFRNTIPLFIGILRNLKRIVILQQSTLIQRSLTRLFGATVLDLPPCVDPARFHKKDYTTLQPRTLKIVTIAKFQQRKNLHILIKSLASLQQKYPSITFHLTIAGVVLDKQYYTDLTNGIKSQNIESQVVLHTECPHGKVKRLLAESDLFILPSSREPLGYATIEAMATGLPVITTDEVGAKQTIRPGENGYVIPAKSAPALTQAVENFIVGQAIHTKKLQQFGQASLNTITTEHSPQVFLQRVANLL